ncbi:MAG TPA: ABC transporter ATP-binding protein [Clostridia bacterium]|nr:ABC transporter ATP-binding protein [Clostridia bacterium]HPQ45898.1 ABC transporter ATP-binding protein [Clostridia bacterium]HRX41823.1 ABC transporter ATP-binding protein [Clostridia bacterium]
MISINNVTKTYGSGIKAVDSLSLEVRKGEIFGFLGPNGAGKTTTIKMVTGILPPDEGTVLINGYDIAKDPINAKMEIGFVSDDPNVFERLKGLEYLNFMADIYKVPAEGRRERILELADEFEMTNALDDKIQSYSHGMKQKIVVMGVLIHDPDVWILDEPLSGLDPKSSFTLKKIMRDHADKGNTVMFSTHVLEVAEKVCDRIAVINKGRILFVGTLAEMKATLKTDTSLEKMFLEMTDDE